MKRAFLLVLLVGAFVAALSPNVRATPGWSGVVSMDPGSGVAIEIVCPFTQIPTRGYMPYQIRITNHSGGARMYGFQLSSSGTYPMNGTQMVGSQSVRAENDAETRVQALLPLQPQARGMGNYRPIIIEVDGYGVETPQLHVPPNYRPSSDQTVFVGMGEQLYTRSWGVLEKQLSDHGKTLYGSRVDLTLLPPDWRALSGVGCLWLTAEEYASADAGRQTAIRDWVSRGGVLYVCETAADQPSRTEFGLRDPAGRSIPFGFGEVHWFRCEAGKELPVEQAASEIRGLNEREEGLYQDAQDWAIAKSVGKLKLNAPFLLSFIGLFAVLIGPLNLFYFARTDRRHRLFWTTPVISLGASLLLIIVIVFQDGFGGNGSRLSLTYLLPAQNKAVTVQEQASRTGVLLSRGFMSSDDLVVSPVNFKTSGNRRFQQSGNSYDGDWFVSRSLQAQRVETIQPTRARVQLLNAEQTKAGAPPVVVSSLPIELEELYFLDERYRYWRGRNVRTGEQQTLRADDGPPHNFNDVVKGSSYLERLRNASRRPGEFYALAKRGPLINTLRSIQWIDDRAVYLGPVTTDR